MGKNISVQCSAGSRYKSLSYSCTSENVIGVKNYLAKEFLIKYDIENDLVAFY